MTPRAARSPERKGGPSDRVPGCYIDDTPVGPSPRTHVVSRPSKSADAAKRDGQSRIAAMTARERAILSLELGEEMREVERRAKSKKKRR